MGKAPKPPTNGASTAARRSPSRARRAPGGDQALDGEARPPGEDRLDAEVVPLAAAAGPAATRNGAGVAAVPASFGELLDVTLPLGAPPSSLSEQRTWAEVRKLQLDTERTRLELAHLRRRERDAVAEAGESHVYTFYAGVDAESVQQCLAELGHWARRSPGAPITVIFNSPGGSVLDGLALFDYLRHLRSTGHHVTTMALGRAASMGAVLLQAGDTRIIGSNAFLLIHEVSNQSTGRMSELEDGVEFTRRLQQRLLAILAERSTLSAAQIQRRWVRKEWWVDAEEAMALGLADEVL